VLEPDLAFYKLPQCFPNNFGEGVYFTMTSSQTKCTLVDGVSCRVSCVVCRVRVRMRLSTKLTATAHATAHAGMGEYAPQTDNGKMFYLLWHQQGLTSSSFLFSTVVLAILKWSK